MKFLNRKIIWILAFLFIFFPIFTTTSFASNINMNHIEDNTITNEVVNNMVSDLSNNTTTTAGTNIQTTTTASSNMPTSTSTTVSNILPESNLGLANILNILLITVGVILILLAIAILIRLK